MIKKILFFVLMFFVFNVSCFAGYSASVDITKMNILQIQDAIDKGYLTYEVLMNLYLDRINEYNDKYDAVISINPKALEEAKNCDIEYKKNGRSSSLFGIPILVKDNIDVVGLPTTGGSKNLEDSYPVKDAKVIENLKKNGAIVIGKANMSFFAFMASSSTSNYGTVKNSYNTKYSSYGSSGGSAVGVSLGFAPVAIGTDTNASLRAPSSANGVIGFRPSYDTFSMDGIIAYDITRDVVGPISKYLVDNLLVYQAMNNQKLDISFLDDIKNIKIGVVDQFLYGDSSSYISKSDEKIVKLFEDMLKKLEEAGAEIVHLDDFYLSSYNSVRNKTLGGWTMCYAFNKYIKNTSSDIKSFYDLAYAGNNTYSLAEYLDDCDRDIKDIDDYTSKKKEFNDDIVLLFEEKDIDVVVYPTNRNLLLKLNDDNILSNSILVSPVLGLPSCSVNMGYIDSLPYGVEFMGLKNQDLKLYQVLNFYYNTINNYEAPKDASSLYEIPESVKKLQDIYEENKDTIAVGVFSNNKIKNYKEVLSKVKDFFLNYYSYEEQDNLAKQLYKDYSIAVENLKDHNHLFFVGCLLILLAFIILYWYLNYYLSGKRKRKRRKTYKRS